MGVPDMGLLDFMQSDDARLGIGLLAAAGPSPMGLGERLQSVISGMDAHKANQAKSKFYDMQYQTGLLGLDKAKREAATEQAVRDAAAQSFRSPEQAAAMSVGPTPNGGVVQYEPGFDTTAFLQRLGGIDPLTALSYQQKLKKDPIKLGAGDTLLDPTTFATIASAPKPQELPSDVRAYQFAQGQGYQGSFTDWQLEQKRAGAPKMPAINLSDPTAVARAGMDLQDKVRGAFKGDNVIANQYNAMLAAVKNPSAQGDTALLYSLFKVLDPESTVREGEIGMVKDSRSIPDRFKGYAQKLHNGQLLLPHEREDILEQARRQVQSRMPRAKQDVQAYRENAKRLELDPNLYVPDPYEGLKFDAKQVKRRGKYGGRNVVEYSDGSIEYAD